MTRVGLLCLAVNCVTALSSNFTIVCFSELLLVNTVDTWPAAQLN